MKKRTIIISILAFLLVFCCFSYLYGAFTIEDRLEKLCDFVDERNVKKIDSLIAENADVYIELDSKVIFDDTYANIKDEIKKVLKDENIHLSLSMLDYSAKCKIFSVLVSNPLFFTNEANGNYGELKYEIEFSNLPFAAKIISIRITDVTHSSTQGNGSTVSISKN